MKKVLITILVILVFILGSYFMYKEVWPRLDKRITVTEEFNVKKEEDEKKLREITSSDEINKLKEKVIIKNQIENLYFDKDTTIDDIDVNDMIRYAVSKYIDNNNISVVDMRSYSEDSEGNLIPEIESNAIKIEKSIIDQLIKDEFNTTKEFSMNSKDIIILRNFSSHGIIYDKKQEAYYIVGRGTGGANTEIRNKVIKAEEDNNYAYLYSKVIICDNEGGGEECGSPSDGFFTYTGTGFDIQNNLYNCAWPQGESVSNECKYDDLNKLIDYVYDTYDNEIDTYKTTFKKVDGNYYWISSEIVK